MAQRLSQTRQQGAAFIVALVIVAVIGTIVMAMARQMHTEALAASRSTSQMRARLIVQGVMEGVKADLNESGNITPGMDFLPVEAEVMGEGIYWVIRPDFGSDDEASFGVLAENSRLNLSDLPVEVLERLPRVDRQMAAAIVDWRDGNEDLEPSGAESEYYLTLPEPYYAKQGRFETLGELLLVRDIDESILYGEDFNRNGVLDPNENDADASPPDDNADGVLDVGLLDYLTVYTLDPTINEGGRRRQFINEPSNRLGELLRRTIRNDRRYNRIRRNILEGRPFRNLLDFYVKSGMTPEEYASFDNQITVHDRAVVAGLLNIRTTPAVVLDVLPGMTSGDGERVVSARPAEDANQTGIAGSQAWIVEVLGEVKAVQLGDWLQNTDRAYQFSADIVAITADGRGFCRWRVVFNTLDRSQDTLGTGAAEVLFVEDLTHLGWPLDPAIPKALQAGEPVEEVAERYRTGLR